MKPNTPLRRLSPYSNQALRQTRKLVQPSALLTIHAIPASPMDMPVSATRTTVEPSVHCSSLISTISYSLVAASQAKLTSEAGTTGLTRMGESTGSSGNRQ